MGVRFSNLVANLMTAISGGTKVQSGTGTATVVTPGTPVTVTITFPVSFSGAPNLFFSPTAVGASSATYITILLSSAATTSQVALSINSGVAQVINFDWIAIGT